MAAGVPAGLLEVVVFDVGYVFDPEAPEAVEELVRGVVAVALGVLWLVPAFTHGALVEFLDCLAQALAFFTG
jgi:hypothetical protein